MKSLLYHALYLTAAGTKSYRQGWGIPITEHLLVPALAAVVLLGEWAIRRRRRHRLR
jgi:hypothetical protein